MNSTLILIIGLAGILALILLIIGITEMARKPQTVQTEIKDAGPVVVTTTKLCPHCKSEIPIDASICKFCGKDTRTYVILGKAMSQLDCSIITIVLIGVPLVLLGIFLVSMAFAK